MVISDSKCSDFREQNFILGRTSLAYLPQSIFTGIFYYSVVIKDVIYAFGIDSNFKFDGNQWVELSRFNSQVGFHPDIPTIPCSGVRSSWNVLAKKSSLILSSLIAAFNSIF